MGTDNETIYFEIILPKSAYLNYRLGRNTIIKPGETSMDAYNRACEEAEQWHKLKHPELYKFNDVTLSVEESEIIQQMALCDTIDKLAAYKGNLTPNTRKYYTSNLERLSKPKK
jgi:hypothetical protein